MIFYRVKSEGIAHNSYLVGSGNEAIVIDPRRDCRIYLDIAAEHGLRITRIFETHRNEDYVIGSLELERHTGAEIFHGQGLDWRYGSIVSDGELYTFGEMWIRALSTPGHTDESMSYVIGEKSSSEVNIMVFTGDALFIGDTGRIDLYGEDEAERLAGNLYNSIHNKILPLGDGVILCPAHGSGSVCGSSISERDESTLGIEKLTSPWLRINSRDDFIKAKTAEKLERPHYFRKMEKYNLEGPPLLGDLPQPVPLSPEEFEEKMNDGAVVVDTGQPVVFSGAHISNAYSIWLEGLPVFTGWVMSYETPILLVLEKDSDLEQAVRYLVRAGYDNIAGYLRGGTEAWYNAGLPIDNTLLLSVHELKTKLDNKEDILVLDVRDDTEWDTGHVEGALHVYVGHIEEKPDLIPRDTHIAVMCTVGHRASFAGSILLRAGYGKVSVVPGSYDAWTAAGYPLVMK